MTTMPMPMPMQNVIAEIVFVSASKYWEISSGEHPLKENCEFVKWKHLREVLEMFRAWKNRLRGQVACQMTSNSS
jgi:hypothetical protein